MSSEETKRKGPGEEKGEEGFSGLIRYTILGYIGGLSLAVLLDHLGFQRSALGQWAVRTLSGEGESIFEGIYALGQRLQRATASMAEAYGWGKFLGMSVPWFIDLGSRLIGIDVYGVGGFYIPYFYALSDQIGANILGFLFLRKESGSWSKAIQAYFQHPVMVASLWVVLIVPVGLLIARLLGFSPTTQTYTALETIAANLCWVPPLVGWFHEKNH